MFPVLIVGLIGALIAVGLGFALSKARQQVTELTADVEARSRELQETTSTLESTKETLASSRSRVESQEKKISDLDEQVAKLTAERDETADALRKRTELADAQAMQIDAISAERDDTQEKLVTAEDQISALAARPGAVIGGGVSEGDDAETLWDLEVARTERLWRASVATNPLDDTSPFAETVDPVRTAVEVEAAALREDVGSLITVDWQVEPIEAPARRLLVLRVAQELLARAARAPGASKLLVRQGSGGDESQTEDEKDSDGSSDSSAGSEDDNVKAVGELVLSFEPIDGGTDGAINLIKSNETLSSLDGSAPAKTAVTVAVADDDDVVVDIIGEP